MLYTLLLWWAHSTAWSPASSKDRHRSLSSLFFYLSTVDAAEEAQVKNIASRKQIRKIRWINILCNEFSMSFTSVYLHTKSKLSCNSNKCCYVYNIMGKVCFIHKPEHDLRNLVTKTLSKSLIRKLFFLNEIRLLFQRPSEGFDFVYWVKSLVSWSTFDLLPYYCYIYSYSKYTETKLNTQITINSARRWNK